MYITMQNILYTYRHEFPMYGTSTEAICKLLSGSRRKFNMTIRLDDNKKSPASVARLCQIKVQASSFTNVSSVHAGQGPGRSGRSASLFCS